MAEDRLLVVLNEGRIGDQNQLNGIVDELSKTQSKWSINYLKNIQTSEIEAAIGQACKNSYKLALLTSGPDGIKVIDNISSKLCPSVLVVSSAHMLFKDHINILGKVNILALPSYSFDNEFEHKAEKVGTKIVKTLGVAHNITLKSIEDEYNRFKDRFSWLKKQDKIAMIVLGGDAPDSDGKIHYYTSSEAQKTAEYIGNFCKSNNYSLLIFNGPRTGQYDSTTGDKNADAHTNDKLDEVTESFMKKIETHLKPDQYKLYNYSKNSASPYRAGFWVVKNAKTGKCFLPGESTSMISEANDILPSQTIIISNGAMNESHLKHAILEAKAAKAIVLDENFQEIKIPVDQAISVKARKTNAELIADQIIDDYKNLKLE